MAEPRQSRLGRGTVAFSHQPPGTLRDQDRGDEKDRRRSGFDSEHPSPGSRMFRPQQIGNQIIREIRRQNAHNDIQLADRHEQAATPGRSNLGDIDRRHDRRTADRDASNPSEEQQRIPVPSEGAANRRNEIKDGQHGQHGPSSPPIRGPAYQKRAEEGPDQRTGDREPQEIVVERVGIPQGLRRARDHRGIESEQERPQRRDDRAGQQQCPAAAFACLIVVNGMCLHALQTPFRCVWYDETRRSECGQIHAEPPVLHRDRPANRLAAKVHRLNRFDVEFCG